MVGIRCVHRIRHTHRAPVLPRHYKLHLPHHAMLTLTTRFFLFTVTPPALQNNTTVPERPICEKLGVELLDGLGDKIQSSSWLIKGGGKGEIKADPNA